MDNQKYFANGMSELVKELILTPISQYINENKGVKCDVNELAAVLSIPATQTSGDKSRKKGIRGRNKKSDVPDELRCSYILTKGDSLGMRCNNEKELASEFCSSCKHKKRASSQKGSFIKKKLSFVSLGGGYYIDTEHNFYLRMGPNPNEYVCLGILEKDKTRPLTPEEETVCINSGYSIVSDSLQ